MRWAIASDITLLMTDRAFPQRTNTHQIAELSERFFRGSLPKNWVCEKPLADYGVDLRVELFEDARATGLELLVQLKASATPTEGASEVVRLGVATYNHLWDKLQVVMLVKFIEEQNEAYWVLFRDIPQPSQEQDTFAVHIPKSNRLSSIDWTAILRHIRNVTDTKLAAARQARTEDARR